MVRSLLAAIVVRRRSRKQAQVQTASGCIQFVNGGAHQRFQLGVGCVIGLKRTSHANQIMRQIGKNLSWPNAVGVCQGAARDGLVAKAGVIKVMALRAQLDLDIAQRLARGQLSKRQRKELIETIEVFDFAMRATGLGPGG